MSASTPSHTAVAASYAVGALRERLQQLVPAGGAKLSPRDLAGLDQFHTGGIDATARIAELLGLAAGSGIIDLGSGLGGPARFFAAEAGLRVHGIDLTPPFVDAARYLTERCGIDSVTFETGDVTRLEVPDASFDGAVMLHVAMNVHDRSRLYAEVNRVLRPGTPFVTYDVVRLDGEPDYPMPWASTAQASRLLTASETAEALDASGFTVIDRDLDRSRAIASFAAFDPAKSSPFAQLLNVSDFPVRISNTIAAFRSGRIAIFTARAIARTGLAAT